MSAKKQTVPVVKKQVPVVTTVFRDGEEIIRPVTKSLFPHLWDLWHRDYPKMIAILGVLANARPDLGAFRIIIIFNSISYFEASLQIKITNGNDEKWLSILSVAPIPNFFIPAIFIIACYEDTFCHDWKKKKINKDDMRWLKDNLTQQLVSANLNGQEEEKRRAMAAVMCMFFYTGDTIFLPNKKFIAILKLL